MKNFQKIKIDDQEFLIIDSIQNLRAEDSFIHRENKLSMFDGSGEARKYIGSYTGENGKRLSEFFEYSDWGNVKLDGKRTYPVFQNNTCFFSKSNLLKYLFDARIEYQKQEQIYKNDISKYYNDRLEEIQKLEKDKIFFSIYDVSDLIENSLDRGYIRSDDEIWGVLRKLVLPKISYLSILKLIPLKAEKGHIKPFFYFRLLLDYQFRSIVHPKLSESTTELIFVEENKKTAQKYTAREGAQLYRKRVIEHMPQCPFTKITDERLLIASHIKPYKACLSEKNIEEALDYLNGLSLTPTYDKLFDQGYITFTDNGELICGTQLTAYTWERLNINPNAKNLMRIYPENREKYLDYHRKFVFQDEISDFI